MEMIRRLVGYLEGPERRRLRWFAVLCFLTPAANLFSVSMLIPVFEETFGAGASPELLLRVVWLALLLMVVGLFELLKSRASSVLVADVAHRWSVKIYELYCCEELQDHNEKGPVEAINGVRGDVTVCAGLITTYMDLVVDAITLAAYFVIITYIAGWVGVASCLLILAMMLLLFLRKRIGMRLFGDRMRVLKLRADGLVSTAYGSYRELRIDNRRENLIRQYRQANGAYTQVQKEFALMQNLQGILLQNVMQAALFLFLALVLALGVDLAALLAEAVLYLTLLVRMIPNAKRSVAALTTIQYGTRYYEAICRELERYREMKAREAERAGLRQKRVTLDRGIRVEGLTFRYPGGENILENASVAFPAGSSVAIIGLSGAGKSTFLDLMLGLLRPQAGSVWYDDYDIVAGADSQGPCRASIGEVVSYIPQTIFLNNGTVRDNVVFMAGERDDERVIECLKCAQVWEDVKRMPQGLDTMIGQNGTVISGGQRQRIALARALYKDFCILIMDEATAALDLETEKAVMDSISQLRGRRTLLMVTHHPALADACQEIYRMEGKGFVKVR